MYFSWKDTAIHQNLGRHWISTVRMWRKVSLPCSPGTCCLIICERLFWAAEKEGQKEEGEGQKEGGAGEGE